MTKEELIDNVSAAYSYGFRQKSKRVEPKKTILSWCGYNKLPKPHGNAIYAAYKIGVYNRTREQPNETKQ